MYEIYLATVSRLFFNKPYIVGFKLKYISTNGEYFLNYHNLSNFIVWSVSYELNIAYILHIYSIHILYMVITECVFKK